MEHHVGQQVDGATEVVAVDGGIEGGVLLVGEGVQFAAHLLQGVDNLQGVSAGRSLEGDVFAEVRQSLLARLFMTSTCRYLVAAEDDGRGGG